MCSFSLWSILKLTVLELRAVEGPTADILVASAATELESDGVLKLLAEGPLRLHVAGLHSRRGLVEGRCRGSGLQTCWRFITKLGHSLFSENSERSLEKINLKCNQGYRDDEPHARAHVPAIGGGGGGGTGGGGAAIPEYKAEVGLCKFCA